MSHILAYNLIELDGRKMISFPANVTVEQLRTLFGKLSLEHIAALAYKQPRLFALYCLYHGWMRTPKDAHGFAPLDLVEAEAANIAQNIRSTTQ